jgi:nucleotide-binding universal stress UspA family protein
MQHTPFHADGALVLVVGVDYSPSSIAALEAACALARARPPAIVHAVHAVTFAPVAQLDVVPRIDLHEERRRIDALCCARAEGDDVHVIRHVALDRPDRAIVDVARDHEADVIVVGMRRRTGLERMLLGSLTDRIVHAAPCAVLAVPEPPRAEEDAVHPMT